MLRSGPRLAEPVPVLVQARCFKGRRIEIFLRRFFAPRPLYFLTLNGAGATFGFFPVLALASVRIGLLTALGSWRNTRALLAS